MNTHKGFAMITVLIVIAGLLVIGGGAYVVTHPEIVKAPAVVEEDDGVQTEPGDHQEVDREANEGVQISGKTSIVWKFTDLGEDAYGMSKTNVSVTVNGTTHNMGTFNGSCSEVGASGGINGKGLLAGELSAVQCWYAGSGDEIGVFAHENGGFDIMVGELGEQEPGEALFRGNFKIKVAI